MPLFDEEDNKIIREYMKKYGNLRNRYVLTSKEIPKYKPKQIHDRWKNYLDPRLCFDPLTDDEKNFIAKEVQKHEKLMGKKNWARVLRDLESKFGKCRSENQVKNYWSLRQRKSPKNKRKSQNKKSQNTEGQEKTVSPSIEEQEQKQEQESVHHLNITYQQYPSILSTMEPCVTFKLNEPNRMQPFF